MDSTILLNNGIRMPVLGLGTWLSQPGEVEAAVGVAIDAGYRLIDTAYVYGNETEIGNALQKAFKEGKLKRDQIFITTKVQFLVFLLTCLIFDHRPDFRLKNPISNGCSKTFYVSIYRTDK